MTATTVVLKPTPGLSVRDPQTARPLHADGEPKELNSYWLRRLREGDVIRVEEKAASKTPTKAGK
jgi:hypothetical protein